MKMIKTKVGNLLESIEEFNLDGIMNAANGIGRPMGRGIAGAIRLAGGNIVEQDAYDVCCKLDPKAGDVYCSISGKLKDRGIKKIIHACTMKQPGGFTSLDIVRNAFSNALELAYKMNIKTLGCTALGTGVGNLDPIEVGIIMGQIAITRSKIDIVFIDFDNKFIDTINELL